MPDFTYEARARTGSMTSGTIAANSEREAAMALDAKGLFPIKIGLARTQAAGRKWFGGRVSARTADTRARDTGWR